MSACRRILPSVLSAIFSLALVQTVGAGDKQGWKPIEPEHMSLKAPVVEKDAEAEALFWEAHVEKGIEGAELRHYVRIKIFTERGCETQKKVELPFFGGNKIADVAARTIKADGTVVELAPGAIFETTIAKFGKYKVMAKASPCRRSSPEWSSNTGDAKSARIFSSCAFNSSATYRSIRSSTSSSRPTRRGLRYE